MSCPVERSHSRLIRALVLDIDGVLTDGQVMLDPQGREYKRLCYRDIDAIFQARREGLLVALVSGEKSPMVDVVAARLAIETVVSNAKDKVLGLRAACARLGVELAEICYVGDSDRDASALAQVRLGLAPANASPQARLSAHRMLTSRGGEGAVAEALFLIRGLNADGRGDGDAPVDLPGKLAPSSFTLKQRIVATLAESVAVKQAVIRDLPEGIALAARWIIEALRSGGRLLLFGDDGDPALIQHIAAQLAAHFEGVSRDVPVVVLSADTPVPTAHGGGPGVQMMPVQQVAEVGRQGDLALVFSAGSDSLDLLHRVSVARARGVRVVCLTDQEAGGAAPLCDLALGVPSRQPARIRECHITICAAIGEGVEAALTAEE